MPYNHFFVPENSPNPLKNKNFIKISIIIGLTALFCMNSVNAWNVTNGTYTYDTADAIQLAINDQGFGNTLIVAASLQPYNAIVITWVYRKGQYFVDKYN